MNVGLLLISHPGIATALLTNAFKILGRQPMKTRVLEVAMDTDLDALQKKARDIIHELDQDDGVLILTDLYGASPCNLAYQFKDDEHIRIVSGLNLSMLIRTLNYSSSELNELTEKAASGATDGVKVNHE